MMDVVYIVKPGEQNEELRYSLRSIAENLPHNQVFIAGYMPRWVKNVHHIHVYQNYGNKYKNAQANWEKACNDERVSDDFIYMNDDFFIMKPIKSVPTAHRGSLNKIIEYYEQKPAPYLHGMKLTREILEKLGKKNLKSYALHIPMVMNKEKRMLIHRIQGLVNTEWRDVHHRTLYGNYWEIGGRKMDDVKFYSPGQTFTGKETFLSTSDKSFKQYQIGRHIRRRFKTKCKYEN